MKITRLEILKVPPSWVWLRMHTDEGVTGLGEPYLENHPESVIAEVRRLEPLLLGRRPLRRVPPFWLSTNGKRSLPPSIAHRPFQRSRPPVRQAVRWIAPLGGFLGRKGDGEPGIPTLWRGWSR